MTTAHSDGWQEPLGRMKAKEQARIEAAGFMAPIAHAAIRAYERAAEGADVGPCQAADRFMPAWDKMAGPARADFTTLVRACIADPHISPQGLYLFADRTCGGTWGRADRGIATRLPPQPWHGLPVELRRGFALIVHTVRALSVS